MKKYTRKILLISQTIIKKSNFAFLFFLILLFSIAYKYIPLNYRLKNSLKELFYKKFPHLKRSKFTASKVFFPKVVFVISSYIKKLIVDPKIFALRFKIYQSHLLRTLSFKHSVNPLVSIIIPVYGQINYTIACLLSIAQNKPECTFEIIIVDDASLDNSSELLKSVSGVKVFVNPVNCGFIKSCNLGAKKAKGHYVYFLNNDTRVTKGWLDHLVQTFSDFPGTGLAGSKLVYPNGKLQEAGGIIWRDGSAWNFGRGEDPDFHVYNYAREVDYCSGASIMIPKQIFNHINGFDPYYLPAYCEDSDLALKLRSKGYRVIYQPLSIVIHFEGITSGKNINSGIKSYQVENMRKQYNRWKSILSKHERNGEHIDWAINRRADKKVLVLDENSPQPDKDAGSLLTFNLMLLLREMNFQVTFIARDLQYSKKYTSLMQRFGIEVAYLPHVKSIKSHLKEYGARYDLIFLFRPNLADDFIDICRSYAYRAKIIYHSVDLHFLRILREAKLMNDRKKETEALKMKKLEINIIKRMDASIVVSKAELKMLKYEGVTKNVYLLSLIKAASYSDKPFKKRRDIIFVGGFNHQPNVDAIKFFVKEVMPILWKNDKSIIFYIVGSNIPQEIIVLQNSAIKILGFVEKLDPVLNNMRVMVAPLRYGAGVKGKIVSAMSLGLPVVATPVAAEGMGLTHKENILIADDAKSFAESVLELYKNEKLWRYINKSSLNFVEHSWGPEISYKNLSKIISKLEIPITKPRYKLSLYNEND